MMEKNNDDVLFQICKEVWQRLINRKIDRGDYESAAYDLTYLNELLKSSKKEVNSEPVIYYAPKT